MLLLVTLAASLIAFNYILHTTAQADPQDHIGQDTQRDVF